MWLGIIVLGLIGLCLGVLLAYRRNKTTNEYHENPLDFFNQQGFSFNEKIEINRYVLGLDQRQNKLLILQPKAKQKNYLLAFKDILGLEISQNGCTIAKASCGAPMDSGGAGAISAVIAGGKPTAPENMEVEAVIKVNDAHNPVIRIPMVEKNTPESTLSIELKQANQLWAWFKIILQKKTD